MSSWTAAFKHAKSVEAEGRLAFSDVLDDPNSEFGSRHSKRKALLDQDGGQVTEEIVEDDHPKAGCFRQPVGLSQFYKRIKSSNDGTDELATTTIETEVEDEAARLAKNMAKQICRQWLKHHYLQLGEACDGSKCGRSHAPPSSAKQMYKDYSFKGLPKQHRAKIIDQIEKEKKVL